VLYIAVKIKYIQAFKNTIFKKIKIFLQGTIPGNTDALSLLKIPPQKRSEFEIKLTFPAAVVGLAGIVTTPLSIRM